jgi:hypothetical protein
MDVAANRPFCGLSVMPGAVFHFTTSEGALCD